MFFQKTNCIACGRRVNKHHRFCPFCGANLNTGVHRLYEERDEFADLSRIKLPFPFGKIFEKLTKELERELGRLQEEDFEGKRRVINIRFGPGLGPGAVVRKPSAPLKRSISKEDITRYAKLPREEAKTNVKRLSDKVVYEIFLPGVKSIKDVFVHKLQDSIEVKAFGKDKAYFKLIPVDLNVKRYGLKDELLILELKE